MEVYVSNLCFACLVVLNEIVEFVAMHDNIQAANLREARLASFEARLVHLLPCVDVARLRQVNNKTYTPKRSTFRAASTAALY